MARKGTNNINDYISDYERAMQDYSEMGPLWAEMVFGDDFEAIKALYRPTDAQTPVEKSGNQSGNRTVNKRH